MPRTLLRALAAVVLLGGAVAGTSGCVVNACPAIAYISTVVVDVSAFPAATDLQFCADGQCSPGPGEDASSSANLFSASPSADGTWSMSFDMSTPDLVDIRLFDAQGAVIHESEQEISWTRTEGQCPGPASADPLVVEPAAAS
ncbi:hypothetical protein ABTZ44_18795 [Microbacterium oxydans]|jgi:hypothetical protein|uniref:hypothetical protein n=1 Tax=Microbacterium TaxID=33882 RepID=UPI0007346D43|nr:MULTISPECIES: hypothetical protein [Microbacterium]KTR76222.1 hypothetical protein NS234_12420 [Microbacterium oxydans]MBE7956018.1 hypothetical protein [Microbacterium sp. R1]MCB8043314.1 hypothetical protein [Microbacterium oxydans]NYF28646.1 hypothetical protein [Microbacterium sp. JAI119]RBO71685.1 hypothetical protein DSP71_15115 [Microbacterium sp. H6]